MEWIITKHYKVFIVLGYNIQSCYYKWDWLELKKIHQNHGILDRPQDVIDKKKTMKHWS